MRDISERGASLRQLGYDINLHSTVHKIKQNYRNWCKPEDKKIAVHRLSKHPIVVHCSAAITYNMKSHIYWYVEKENTNEDDEKNGMFYF